MRYRGRFSFTFCYRGLCYRGRFSFTFCAIRGGSFYTLENFGDGSESSAQMILTFGQAQHIVKTTKDYQPSRS